MKPAADIAAPYPKRSTQQTIEMGKGRDKLVGEGEAVLDRFVLMFFFFVFFDCGAPMFVLE